MRKVIIGILALSLMPLLPEAANAYQCGVPAVFDANKKTVCASPVLANLDQAEVDARRSLGLSREATSIVSRDRQSFTKTRGQCGGAARCLEATYRAQIRLYTKLKSCASRQGPQQTFCVSKATQQHRQDLHRSM
jgi:uncharacterized protein